MKIRYSKNAMKFLNKLDLSLIHICTANLQTPQPEEPPRRDSYASSLEMLFGKKWRGEEPESDDEARRLLRADVYKRQVIIQF